MDGNKVKVIIAVVLLAAAGVVVAMQLGLFGGSSSSTTTGNQAIDSAADVEGNLESAEDRGVVLPRGNRSYAE